MIGSTAASRVASGPLAFALTAKGFLSYWIVYVFANALIQSVYSHTLYTDDAEESLLVQTIRFGYTIRNPPLWEWLLWTIQQAIGPGFESHLLLRYGCIAFLGIAVFRASRAVSGDVGWSSAVALSLPLFYALGWVSFRSNTHSLLLLIACLFSLEIAIRYAFKPTYGMATLFGLVVGLGFLTKYGYGVPFSALILALLASRETRAAVLRREFVLVPLVATVVFSPFLYWLTWNHADLLSMAHENLVTHDATHFRRSLMGLGRVVELSIEFFMPSILIATTIAWQGRRHANGPMVIRSTGEQIAGLTFLISVAMLIAGILMIGATKFTGTYLMPILILAIPYGASLLSRAAPGARDALAAAAIGISSLVFVSLLHWAYLANSGFPEDSSRRDMWPIAGLASEMRSRGYDHGTLVTASFREGGNLRAELPDLRVVSLDQSSSLRPRIEPTHTSACRLLWNDTESISRARWARSRDRRVIEDVPQLAGKEQLHFDIPWPSTYFGTARTSRWTIVHLDPSDPLCR